MLIRTSKDKDHPYVMLNKTFLEDQNLSLKAKGLLAYCMSKPDGWQFHVDQLVNVLKEGKDAIYSGFKELSTQGYCIIFRKRNSSGCLQQVEYVLFETRKTKKEIQEIQKNNPTVYFQPQRENPVVDDSSQSGKPTDSFEPNRDFPDLENPPLIINECSNNERNNKQAAVVVPSFIQEIKDLTEDEKRALAKFHEERVKLAIEFNRTEKPTHSKIQQMVWHCQQEIPPKPASRGKKNELYDKIVQLKKTHESIHCELRVTKQAVFFVHHGQGDPIEVKFSEEGSYEKIKQLFAKYQFVKFK